MGDFEEKILWHELKERPLTDEEKAKYAGEGYADYEAPEYTFDCQIPDDLQAILIVTRYGVALDTCWRWRDKCGFRHRLERRGDWDGVLAWADMPKYKAEGEKHGS